MFLQDNDPHHLHPDPYSIYYFVILAVILVALTLFAAVKLMNFLDNRYERKKPIEKDAETAPESDRHDNQ
jgi:large-conductance mechanosensitive channel